ncbi:MAG TPA: sulfate adenylyltransferase, partial [Thermoplasmata archaeon]|nr:sulfate adenylyltransferase [Thermoplasmata archaeon]
MIPQAHGGRLVDRLRPGRELERREAEHGELPCVAPFVDQVYDAEKIGIGAYSPLEGFQDSETVASISTKGVLPSGLPWSMPIVLTPSGAANESVVR